MLLSLYLIRFLQVSKSLLLVLPGTIRPVGAQTHSYRSTTCAELLERNTETTASQDDSALENIRLQGWGASSLGITRYASLFMSKRFRFSRSHPPIWRSWKSAARLNTFSNDDSPPGSVCGYFLCKLIRHVRPSLRLSALHIGPGLTQFYLGWTASYQQFYSIWESTQKWVYSKE